MAVDICIIILTAFAIFGGYCLGEMISDFLDRKNMPPSVILMAYSRDDYTAKKVKTTYNYLYNNKIIFVTDNESTTKENIYPDSRVVKNCEISQAVTDALFTKIKG